MSTNWPHYLDETIHLIKIQAVHYQIDGRMDGGCTIAPLIREKEEGEERGLGTEHHHTPGLANSGRNKD